MTEIIASKVSEKKIYYKCPFCWTNQKGRQFNSKYFKNGKEAVGRFPTTHHHGNETQKLDNFTTSRSSHCSFVKGNIDLIINDSTKRVDDLIVYF